jgi:hypothetical protein
MLMDFVVRMVKKPVAEPNSVSEITVLQNEDPKSHSTIEQDWSVTFECKEMEPVQTKNFAGQCQ